jgi:hypothetical protein
MTHITLADNPYAESPFLNFRKESQGPSFTPEIAPLNGAIRDTLSFKKHHLAPEL